MPVNHADGTLFASVILCPIASTAAAVHAGANWLAVYFMPLGLGVGILIAYWGRIIVYSILTGGLRKSSKETKLRQWLIGFPIMTLYIILPLVIAWGGIAGIWFGTIWLVTHLF